MDISAILISKFPGTEWTMKGDDYAGLEWLDITTKPSESELLALWPIVSAEIRDKNIQRLRQAAYAEISDPIFFQWQRKDGKTEQDWLDAIEQIKIAYPYEEITN